MTFIAYMPVHFTLLVCICITDIYTIVATNYVSDPCFLDVNIWNEKNMGLMLRIK